MTTCIRRTPRLSSRTITMTAMLAAISTLLAFVEFQVPLSPSFARMDLSDFPAMIAAFAFGPLYGVLVELVKNLIRLLTTSTAGVGELANFMIGSSFALTAGLVYRFHKTRRQAVIACILASFVMGITAALMNYFILLPMFELFMPLDQIIAAFGSVLPFIQTKLDVVLYNAFPFNLLKGLLISVMTLLVYKRIRPVLKGLQ